MFRSTLVIAGLLACLAPLVSGCVPAAVGTGAAAGTVAAQDRGLSGALADTEIRTEINHLWFQADEKMYRKVSLQVQQRRVLLTGIVTDPEMRQNAAKLAWKAEGVKEVINEIEVSDADTVGTYTKDTWISAQLKSKILFDTEIKSINYSIETINGTIYLLGTARNRTELDRVLDHARNLANVKEVVSYVEILDETSRSSGEAEKGESV